MAMKKFTTRPVKSRKPTWEDGFAAKFDAQPAQITPEQRDRIEAQFSTSNGMWRRLGLATLAQSGSELIEAVTADREIAIEFAYAANITKEYAAMLRNFAGLMDTASARISVALCSRPDMVAVMHEAEAVQR